MGVYSKKTKKGIVYYINYYYEGRRIREKIGTSKKLADTVLKKRQVEIAEGKFLDKKEMLPKVKFEALAQRYLEWAKVNKQKSYKTKIYIVKILLKTFSGMFIDEITAWLIEKHKNQRRAEVTNSTLNRDLACLKKMFSMAVEWGILEKNPARGVKLLPENKSRLRWLTQEEIQALLKE